MKSTFTCDVCKHEIGKNHYYHHLTVVHGLDRYVSMGKQIHQSYEYRTIPENVLSEYFQLIDANPTRIRHTTHLKQFKSFYEMVVSARDYRKTDTIQFVNVVLAWKLSHPKICNSKELCRMIFPDEPECESRLYQKMLENNPYYKHDGRLSPFSKSFVGYNGMTDDEKNKSIRKKLKCESTNRVPNQVEYWISKGYSKDDAVSLVHKRQQTFSLKKCIDKLGEEQGRIRWAERQKKWLDNYKKQNYSNISQSLFWPVYERIKGLVSGIYFATLNQTTMAYETTSANNEYRLTLEGLSIKPDFIVLDRKKIIEFDGDYWHNNGNGRGNKSREARRDFAIVSGGYSVLHIREKEFVLDKNGTIDRCVAFILGEKNEQTTTST